MLIELPLEDVNGSGCDEGVQDAYVRPSAGWRKLDPLLSHSWVRSKWRICAGSENAAQAASLVQFSSNGSTSSRR
jgi:hypothetical protein